MPKHWVFTNEATHYSRVEFLAAPYRSNYYPPYQGPAILSDIRLKKSFGPTILQRIQAYHLTVGQLQEPAKGLFLASPETRKQQGSLELRLLLSAKEAKGKPRKQTSEEAWRNRL